MMRRILVLAAVVAALSVPAAASAQTLQPGASITNGDSFCTANWIFDGPGGPYVGTAAHCFDAGEEISLSTSSLGSPVAPIGPVAFDGNEDQHGRDYAFIRIANPALTVNPAMAGHPNIPTGVSTGYAEGDLMQFSGHGVGFNGTGPTREQRQGVLNFTDGVEHDIIGGVAPGDSGGPVADLDDGNTAFGIVNTVGAGVNSGAFTVVTAGEGGANLDFVLEDAAAHGFPVTLRTVG